MVNLMNTCLVANTLLLSIDIVTMGFMKNKQDISSWGKEIVSWYWITLPLSICSHGSVSVYATALLCILSFIDHNDEEKMTAFHKWFNYSIHFIGKGTVLNFWLTGIRPRSRFRFCRFRFHFLLLLLLAGRRCRSCIRSPAQACSATPGAGTGTSSERRARSCPR